MARQKDVTLFNKNNIKITRHNNLPKTLIHTPYVEQESILSSSGGEFKRDRRFYTIYETKEITLESPLGFYYTKKIKTIVDSGDTTNARKQLEKDLEVAKIWGIIDGNTGDYSREGKSTSKLKSCNDMTKTEDPVRKKATVQACSNELNVQIGLFLDTRAREARQQDKR